VRHADDDVRHAAERGRVDHGLHAADHGLAALEAEALGRVELGREDVFELFGEGEALEDVRPLVERQRFPRHLDARPEPVLLAEVRDVLGLDADGAAVPVWNSNLRRVRPGSPRRPPRHRRDACSTAPDALVDFHTARYVSRRKSSSSASVVRPSSFTSALPRRPATCVEIKFTARSS